MLCLSSVNTKWLKGGKIHTFCVNLYAIFTQKCVIGSKIDRYCVKLCTTFTQDMLLCVGFTLNVLFVKRSKDEECANFMQNV